MAGQPRWRRPALQILSFTMAFQRTMGDVTFTLSIVHTVSDLNTFMSHQCMLVSLCSCLQVFMNRGRDVGLVLIMYSYSFSYSCSYYHCCCASLYLYLCASNLNRFLQMPVHHDPGSARGCCLLKEVFSLPLSPSACSWWEHSSSESE